VREILFKAKRTDNGEWVEGLPTIMWEQPHIMPMDNENTAYQYDPETLCQFTGLLDKNGKRIWENDIIKYHFGEFYAAIKYGVYQSCFDSTHTSHCGFFVDWKETRNLRKDLGYWISMVNAGVVGNIFDNLELLATEQN